jgi:hypothetical protein
MRSVLPSYLAIFGLVGWYLAHVPSVFIYCRLETLHLSSLYHDAEVSTIHF